MEDEEFDDRELPRGDTALEYLMVGMVLAMFVLLPVLFIIFGSK